MSDEGFDVDVDVEDEGLFETEEPAPEPGVDPAAEDKDGRIEGDEGTPQPGEEPPARTFKVKVDGEEQEVSEEQLLKDFELRQASYKRFEEAKRLREEAEEREGKLRQVFDRLRTGKAQDFAAFLERLGHDPAEFAHHIAEEVVRRSKMSPEQAELEQLRLQQQQWQRQQQEMQERQRQQQVEARIPQYQEQFLSEFTQAMDAAQVPADEGLRQNLIQRMSQKQLQAYQNGYLVPAAELLQGEWGAIRAAAKTLAAQQAEAERKARLETVGKGKRRPAGKPAQKPAQRPQEKRYTSGDQDAWRALLDGD